MLALSTTYIVCYESCEAENEWVAPPPHSPGGFASVLTAHPWWSNVSNSGKRVTTIGKIRRTRVMIDSSNGLEPAKISEWQSKEYTYYTVMRHWHQCIRVTLKCLFLSPALGIASHWVHSKARLGLGTLGALPQWVDRSKHVLRPFSAPWLKRFIKIIRLWLPV